MAIWARWATMPTPLCGSRDEDDQSLLDEPSVARQRLSRMRHERTVHPGHGRPATAGGPAAGWEPAVRGLAITYPSGTVVLPTERGWDHLVYAAAGVMSVETTVGTWVI